MTHRILLLDPDRPDETLEVDILVCDEVALTVAVPNTIVSFDLIRRDDRAPYRGWLGGRSFLFVPAAPSSATSESASDRPKTFDSGALPHTSKSDRRKIHGATQLRGAGRKGALYGGNG